MRRRPGLPLASGLVIVLGCDILAPFRSGNCLLGACLAIEPPPLAAGVLGMTAVPHAGGG